MYQVHCQCCAELYSARVYTFTGESECEVYEQIHSLKTAGTPATCVDSHTYIHTYVCAYVSIIYVYLHNYIHTCMYVRMYACIQ